MARRTLVNIDKKILRGAIRMGAEDGIENISTIKLSNKIGISEGTIFVHFKTKENLIYECSHFLMDDIRKYATKNKELFSSLDSLYRKWVIFCKYFFEKQDFCKFFDQFLHSKYQYMLFTEAENDLYQTKFNELFEEYSNYEYTDNQKKMLWRHIINSTMSYVNSCIELNSDVLVSDDLKNSKLKFAFRIICSGVFEKYNYN